MNHLEALKNLFNKRIAHYFVVGISVYMLEMMILFMSIKLLGLSDEISVTISYWFGLISSFISQKILVFRNKSYHPLHLSRQALGFAILIIWNYFFTLGMVNYLTPRFSVLIVRTVAIVIITTWNYKLYQLVFKIST